MREKGRGGNRKGAAGSIMSAIWSHIHVNASPLTYITKQAKAIKALDGIFKMSPVGIVRAGLSPLRI